MLDKATLAVEPLRHRLAATGELVEIRWNLEEDHFAIKLLGCSIEALPTAKMSAQIYRYKEEHYVTN